MHFPGSSYKNELELKTTMIETGQVIGLASNVDRGKRGFENR